MAEHKSTCCVEGCGKPVRSSGAIYCEAHYGRVRRHGSTEKRSTLKPGLLEHSGGYLLAHMPGHPLQRQSKRVYQHRAIYYEHHGDGPFNCHWCRARVTWDDMHVDHLNDDVQDNRPANLVASCAGCNQQRGAHKMRVAQKANGRMLTAHGKTMCLADWARHLGLARTTLAMRMAKGIPPERALVADRAKVGPARKRQPLPDYTVDVTTKQIKVW